MTKDKKVLSKPPLFSLVNAFSWGKFAAGMSVPGHGTRNNI